MLPLIVHLWALEVDRANRKKGIKTHVHDVDRDFWKTSDFDRYYTVDADLILDHYIWF